jgi:hypothetical protein
MYRTTIGNACDHFKTLADKALREEIVSVATSNGGVILMREFAYGFWLETMAVYGHPEYLKSIMDGIDTPLSECVPLEDVWPDV